MYTGKPGQILPPSLKLIGGKTRIRKLLYEHFPYHTTYVEPFLGSGTVLIGKYKALDETVGDLNSFLIDYYTVIRDFPLTFYEKMKLEHRLLCVDPESNFAHIKEQVMATKNQVMRAVYFYLITKHCFNGIWRINNDGNCNSSWGGTTRGRGIFTEAWLEAVSKRIQGVNFIQTDYRQLLSKTSGDPKTFVFLDPPYRQKSKENPGGCLTTYNNIRFKDEDHIIMSDTLKKAKYKWLLTINDDILIRDLYKDFNILDHKIFYSCSVKGENRKRAPELIIKNY